MLQVSAQYVCEAIAASAIGGGIGVAFVAILKIFAPQQTRRSPR